MFYSRNESLENAWCIIVMIEDFVFKLKKLLVKYWIRDYKNKNLRPSESSAFF